MDCVFFIHPVHARCDTKKFSQLICPGFNQRQVHTGKNVFTKLSNTNCVINLARKIDVKEFRKWSSRTAVQRRELRTTQIS